MSDTNPAIEKMIVDAFEGKGPMAAGYAAWKKDEVQKIFENSTGAVDRKTLEDQVSGKKEEWAQVARDSLVKSQQSDTGGAALNLTQEDTQSFIGTLMGGGGIMAAIMPLLSKFKPVQDFLATLTTWIGSKIGSMFSKDVKSLSFAEAGEQNADNRKADAAAKAAIDAGLIANDDASVKAFKVALKDGNQTPAAIDNKIALDATFNRESLKTMPDNVKNTIAALQQSGDIVMGGDGKPALATKGAIDTVDQLLNDVLHSGNTQKIPNIRDGSSIAAS